LDPKKRQLIAIAVIFLIVGALFTSFGRSFFSLNTPPVELPAPGSVENSSVSPPSSGSDPYQTVAVTPSTVQSVIATLARSDSYYRELTVESLWNGGSSTTTVQVWTDEGWSHCRQVLPSGAVRHDLVGEGTLYYWYEGSQQYETAPADGASSDLAQRIPTYETVLELEPAAITGAGYELRSGLPCVYAEVTLDEGYQVERYWVSVDSGLLVSAERELDGEMVYRMTAYSDVQIPCPASASFTLPDGTALHTM